VYALYSAGHTIERKRLRAGVTWRMPGLAILVTAFVRRVVRARPGGEPTRDREHHRLEHRVHWTELDDNFQTGE
jgi:hypothetical protein